MTEFDCDGCGETRQKIWGCETEADEPLYPGSVLSEYCGELRRCPRKLITTETRRIMEARAHYERGFLPMSGGSEEQDYKLMRGIMIINQTVGEIEKQDREDDRRKRGR